MREKTKATRGFTLIELLIVVAIIAILAAIAVPNFLEAQTRAKISRAKADMRTVSMGLESFHVDHNVYPLCNNFSLCGRRVADPPSSNADQNPKDYWVFENLSTPISYLTTGFINDPFPTDWRTNTYTTDGTYSGGPGGSAASSTNRNTDPNAYLFQFYKYAALGQSATGAFGFMDVESQLPPPDGNGERANGWYMVSSAGPVKTMYNLGGLLSGASANEIACVNNMYDPTNGTLSTGLLGRLGGPPLGQGTSYGDVFWNTYQKCGGISR